MVQQVAATIALLDEVDGPLYLALSQRSNGWSR